MNLWFTYTLTLTLLIGVLLFDLNVELGVAGGVPYIAVVLMSLWIPGKYAPLILACITSLLTAYGYLQSPSGGEEWKVLTNRGLALFAIWITAITCHFRKRSEEELLLRNQTIESVDQGILITDPRQEDNPIVYCNPAFEEMTGYSDREILGKNCRFLNTRDRDQEGLKTLRRAIEEGTNCRVILKNYKKNGDFFWNELALTCLRDEFGKLTYFVGIVHDITEIQTSKAQLEKAVQVRTGELEGTVADLKRSQEKAELASRGILNLAQDAEADKIRAQDAEAKMQAIVQTAVEGIILIDAKGVVQSMNPGAQRMFGYESEEVAGQNVKMLMPSPFHDEHDQYILNYLTTGEKKIIGVGREVVGRRKDGSTFPMQLSVGEMTVKGEKFFTGIAQDITERKEAEDDLRRSNQELEKFAYISSHDLKSPLRAIDNLSKWIEEDSGDALSESAKKDMATLRGRVRRMNSLIEDLLDYSRIGHHKYDSEEVDVEQLLKEIIDLMEIPEGFEVKVNGQMPTFMTTLPPLKQVFMNLIGNAIKHHNNPAEGQVNISSQDKGSFYEFSISDDGPGIPKEFQKEAFYMFQTLQSRDKVEGSGMGLAFIDKIIRLYEGKVILESEEGQGATFRFTWPKEINREEDT